MVAGDPAQEARRAAKTEAARGMAIRGYLWRRIVHFSGYYFAFLRELLFLKEFVLVRPGPRLAQGLRSGRILYFPSVLHKVAMNRANR